MKSPRALNVLQKNRLLIITDCYLTVYWAANVCTDRSPPWLLPGYMTMMHWQALTVRLSARRKEPRWSPNYGITIFGFLFSVPCFHGISLLLKDFAVPVPKLPKWPTPALELLTGISWGHISNLATWIWRWSRMRHTAILTALARMLAQRSWSKTNLGCEWVVLLLVLWTLKSPIGRMSSLVTALFFFAQYLYYNLENLRKCERLHTKHPFKNTLAWATTRFWPNNNDESRSIKAFNLPLLQICWRNNFLSCHGSTSRKFLFFCFLRPDR